MNNHNLLFNVTRFWKYLSKKRKYQIGYVFLLTLIGALSEMISLAAVVPFLTILNAPKEISNIFLLKLFNFSNGNFDDKQLILFFALFFAVVVLISGLIRSTCLWLNVYMSAYIGKELSTEAFEKSLYIPFEEIIKENSSSKIITTTNFSNSLVDSIYAFFSIISSILIILGLILGLSTIGLNYVISISAFVILFYLIIILRFKRIVKNQSINRDDSSKKIYKLLQECYSIIQNIIVDQNQEFFTEIFRKISSNFYKSSAKIRFLSLLPRYLIETASLLAICLFVVLTYNSDSIFTYITVLGTIAFAIQKLLPAMQQVYTNYVVLSANNYSVNHVLALLEIKPKFYKSPIKKKNLSFNLLRISNLGFKYSKNSSHLFKDINLEIYKGERIGILGDSGTGKSTLIKILMTLIHPTKGDLSLFTDNNLTLDLFDKNNQIAWKSMISYVPQEIYILDSTLAENIAFGIDYEDIDFDLLEKVCKLTQLSQYIVSSRYGYKTQVGERGISISGGQKQRIGIARALYKKASLIFFDESTNSLDELTEKNILNSIYSLNKEITIFMISHKVSNLERCDRILFLNNGKIENL